MKDEILIGIEAILKEMGEAAGAKALLSIPTDVTHGDYTTNVSFQAAKLLKKNPQKLAEEIALKLAGVLKNFKKIEAMGGFINFWLKEDFLIEFLEHSNEDPTSIGKTKNHSGKKIVVEFTDPNPFKEFHIGHLYTNTVGESLSRILEANGWEVWRADYYGDVGMHVAKALWGLQKKLQEDKISFEDLTKEDLKKRIKYLGQAYAKGATAFEEEKDAVEEIKEINKLVFLSAQIMWEKEKNIISQIDYKKGKAVDQSKLDAIYKLYTVGRQWSLEYFESLYKRLGMKFDGYYPESIAGEKGYKLVKEHLKDGVFEQHDGAIVFRGEKSGLHTRVFINSLGFPTYEAKELGLAPWKYEDFKYDRSIIVTGNEIKEYFKVLIAAMLAVEPELGKKTIHLPHGMVRLPEGKMSSRTGKIVTGEALLDEAVKRAKELNKDKLEQESQEDSFDQVGIGAVKYAFLRSSIGKDVEFDFDTSLSLNGNSGPYIQYTYVRTQSLLQKTQKVRVSENSESQSLRGSDNPDIRLSDNPSFPSVLKAEETLLLRKLFQYNSVVERAAEDLAPNTICEYLFKLAQEFNNFYQKYRIVDAQKPEEREFRIALTRSVGMILSSGLSLLGIEAPKRM